MILKCISYRYIREYPTFDILQGVWVLRLRVVCSSIGKVKDRVLPSRGSHCGCTFVHWSFLLDPGSRTRVSPAPYRTCDPEGLRKLHGDGSLLSTTLHSKR